MIELAPGLDIHIIPDADIYKNYRQKPVAITYPTVPTVRELLLTLGILGIATAVGWVFSRLGFIDANIIAVYLLSVLLTSIFTSGYTCGILASFLSVILFNYFLTEPRLSLLAYDSGYPITFAIMLGIALLTGTLAAKLKAHAQLSARDVYRTKILFDTNQQLQKAAKPEDVYQMTATQMQRLMGRNILIYPAHDGVLLAGSFIRQTTVRRKASRMLNRSRMLFVGSGTTASAPERLQHIFLKRGIFILPFGRSSRPTG